MNISFNARHFRDKSRRNDEPWRISLPHGNYVNESTNRIASRCDICIVIFRENIARRIEMQISWHFKVHYHSVLLNLSIRGYFRDFGEISTQYRWRIVLWLLYRAMKRYFFLEISIKFNLQKIEHSFLWKLPWKHLSARWKIFTNTCKITNWWFHIS